MLVLSVRAAVAMLGLTRLILPVLGLRRAVLTVFVVLLTVLVGIRVLEAAWIAGMKLPR
jgi:hypothetical protein